MSVVNIFVALGTLALASATYLLARTTKLMLQETYRGRVDSNAPNVTVIALPDEAIIPDADRSKFIQSTPTLAQISDADLVQIASETIGLATRISLRNEGQVSAFARFDYFGGDNSVVTEASTNEEGVITEVVDGWYVVPRDSERQIKVKWSRPVADWRNASESGDVLEAESWILITDPRKLMSDAWSLKLMGAMFVGRVKDTWWLGAIPSSIIFSRDRRYGAEPKDNLSEWWSNRVQVQIKRLRSRIKLRRWLRKQRTDKTALD